MKRFSILRHLAVFLLAASISAASLAAITVSKSIAPLVPGPGNYPGNIFPGDVTAFKITLSNDNTLAPVTGMAFTDNMAPIMVAGVGLVSNTCGGTLVPVIGATSFSLSGGTIPIAPGGGILGTCDIVIEVTSLVPSSTPTNTLPAGSVSGNDPALQLNGSPASQSFNVLAFSPPTLTKGFNPAAVVENSGVSQLTLQIVNPNAAVGATVPLTTVTDSLPAGMQVAPTPGATATCTGTGAVNPIFAPAAGATTLTITGGTVGRSGTCTLRVNVIGTGSGATGTQGLTNTLQASNVGNTRGLTPPADASATLTVNSPLTVGKAFSPNPLRANQAGGGTLTFTLVNSDLALGLTAVAFSEANIFTSSTGAGSLAVTSGSNTCGGVLATTATGFNLTTAAIAANSSCTVTINFTGLLGVAGVPETFSDQVPANSISNAQGIVNQVSNPASVTVNDGLTVSKTVTPSNPAPGNPVSYTVTVNNFSGSALPAVRVNDPLPGGMTALAIPAPSISGAGCASALTADISTPSTPKYTFDMAAGSGGNASTCAVTFSALVPNSAGVGATLTNTIPVNNVADNNGAGPVSNAGPSNSPSLTTIDTAPISKVFNPVSLSEGSVSQLTLTLGNNSANTLNITDLTDALPSVVGPPVGQVVIASPAGVSTTCGGGPTLTAVPGASSVRIQNATIPARSTCVLSVNVIGPAGIYTNIIPANTLVATGTVNGTPLTPITYPNAVTAPITYNAALSAAKSFSPNPIQQNGRTRVSIQVSNIGTGILNNVSAVDPLPAGMTVASSPNPLTTCGGAPVMTVVTGASTATISGVVLPNGGTCDFQFDVVDSSAAANTNTLPTGNITADGGVRNTAAVSATLNKSVGGINVSKSTVPNSLTAPGQVSVLTITLLNTTAGALSGVSLNDFFTTTGLIAGSPNGMRVAAVPGLSTTCPGGLPVAAPGTIAVTMSGVNLAASGSAGDTCTVTVNVTSTQVGTATNLIPPGNATSTQGVSNTGIASTSLATLGNLGVEKSFIPPTIEPGQRSRMRLRFLNPVAIPLTGLSVTDNLPAGMTVPPGANPITTCPGGTFSAPTTTQVSLVNGTMAAASGGAATTCIAEIDVTAAAVGAFTNVIVGNSVTASAGGVPVSNPPPNTQATLQVRLPVTLAKAFSPTSRLVGQVSTLTITITNPNTIPLTGAVLRDNLPAGLAVALTPNASTTCSGSSVNVAATPSAVSVILSGATLPASGVCTVSVDVVSNIPGPYLNTIPGSALTTAQGVSNTNPATASVVYATPPTIGKQFSPVSIPSGGTSVLTLQLGNGNAVPITLTANLVDTLPTAPGALLVGPGPVIGGTCTGSVTAAAGSGSVTYASGATIPPGGCSITVNVTGTVNGLYNNFIPANALQTDVGNNLLPATGSLTISPLGFISGRVFKDNNVVPNGTFQSGTDTPLSAITVNLTGTDFGPDGVLGGGDDIPGISFTTTTDALGNYAFTGLNAGSYSVTEPTQPSATSNGKTTAGSVIGGGGGTSGTATAQTTTPSAISNITLLRAGAAVASSANNDFAEIAPSSISGTVFLDQNNNGIQNGGDAPINGVTINLSGYNYGPDGIDNGGGGDDVAVTQTTTTNASGNYTFANLLPGNYSVTEPTQPPATSSGITTPGAVGNGGTAGTATGVAVVPSRISNIVLPPNTTASGNNFAEIDNGRRISGVVFLDYNNNGLINGADHGISGQTVTLTGTDINGNPVSATTTTAADGSYNFTGLPEGTYTVNEPGQPAGTINGTTAAGSTGGVASNPTATSSRIATINLTGGNTISADNNFAEQVSAPDLALAKTHNPVRFAAGSANFYTLAVSNIGNLPTAGAVTVTDTLPPGMTLQSGTGSGWVCSGTTTVTCTSNAVIAAGASANPITLRVTLALGFSGQLLTNNAVVAGGGEPAGFSGNNIASDIVEVADSASLSGTVWTDTDHDRVLDAGEPLMPGWTVELLLNGIVINTTITNASGAYSFTGLAPGSGYQVRFRNPAGNIYGSAVPNESGTAYTSGVVSAANPAGATTTDGTLGNLTLVAGVNTPQQSLPLDPSGVVYDAITRLPVAGAVVTISGPPGFNPATQLVSGSATQTTGIDGQYQFILLPGAPAGVYTLSVTTYPAGYLPAVSSLIAPCPGPVAVGAVPAPAAVQDSIAPPATSEAATCPGLVGGGAANSTQYFFSFTLNVGVSANVINNHIPLDPILGGAIVMTKTTPMLNVSRGDLVPYTITATNTLSAVLANIKVDDLIPPGFRYRSGSATQSSSVSPASFNSEPVVNGRDLLWLNQTFAVAEKKTWKMLLVVGAGVGEGEYTNQVSALNSLVNSRVSNVASATVRVVPDPNFDCSDLIGKVFDDKNANGYQDQGEPGIANVRIATPRGLLVTTDADGRFHVTCADIPNSDHGSNFVMKLDERSLPSGYRVTTENPRDVRMTRGKMVKLNFGATVHRVVRLELNGAAFMADGVELQAAWAKQLEALPEQLIGRPSVLRIAYALGKDSPDLARKRLDAVAARVRELWKQHEDKDKDKNGKEKEKRNPLVIETELEGAQ